MNRGYKNKTSVLLSLVFLILMAAIIIAGKSYYAGLRRAIEKEKTNNLSAVADLKVHQIVQWREARLGEALVMMESPFFTDGVSTFLADPNNKAARQRMLDRLKAQMKSYNYHNIILLNSAGKAALLVYPARDTADDMSKDLLETARTGGQPVMSDFFICQKESIPHLEIIAPLFEKHNGRKRLLGYVDLRINPETFLYPFIQWWPTASKSSEITLTRREDGDVLFLNELRFKKGTALNFKIPVTRSDLPAAMGVLGKEGPMVGFDYRGVKVLAVLRAIPGTNWHMVAKIDYDEVFADLLRQEKLILAIMLALIFLTAAVVLTIFLYQRHDFYRSLYIKESEKLALQTHYDYLVKYANDIILLMDDEYRIVEANQRAAETYGYKENEMSGMSVNQLRADQSQPFFKVIDGGIASDGHLFETIHRRSNGKTFPAEVSARTITIDNKRFIQAIIRNISERKQYDLDIMERNKELETLNQQMMLNEEQQQWLFKSMLNAFVLFESVFDNNGNFVSYRFVYINDAYERITGVKSGEVKGKTVHEVWPKTEPEWIRKYGEVAVTGVSQSFDMYHGPTEKFYHCNVYRPWNTPDRFCVIFEDITERKRVEQILETERNNLNAIISITPVALMVIDANERVVTVNQATKNLFGDRGADIGRHRCGDYLGCIHRHQNSKGCGYSPECGACELNGTVKNVLHGKPGIRHREMEVRLDLPGGVENRVLIASVEPIAIDGRLHAVASLYDITERKKAEEDLRKSETQMRILIDTLPEYIWLKNAGGVYLSCNPKFEQFFGAKISEIIGKTDYDFVDKKMADFFREKDQEAINAGKSCINEEEVTLAVGGQKIMLETTKTPMYDESGKLIGVLGIGHDITELKLAELSLQESQEKYRNLVENINDIIFSVDLKGMITYISPVVSNTFGYQPDELIGKSFIEYIHPEDVNLLQTDFERILRGKVLSSEYRISTRDGDYKYVRSTSRAITKGRQTAGVTGIIADITDQKMAEQEKKQIESQLFQAQKMEAIGQLAGGVAHDFNNMLAGIMGNAEILAMKLINEPALLGLVERIISSSEHAANLTKQLLSFSRKGKYQMIPVNIHKIVGEVVSILSNTVDRKIRIKQFLKAGQYTILGDPAQLQNAFLNLGLNARDAMLKGGELIFSTELADLDKNYLNAHHYKLEPGRYLQISVTDTGTGMDQNTKEHLFEPFFTTKEPGKGTGLGLASVYGIVKNHNGSIEVYSESGHGTTMKIYLPITEAEAAEIGPTTKYQDTAGTESILLVDDEEMIRVMASQILTGFGYTVKTCQDGQEAVEYYRENYRQIDLVILDMIMPQLNGREAFAEMKKINPGIKALLSSGFSADGEAQEIIKEGVKDFVQKPFRIAELTAKVRKALG